MTDVLRNAPPTEAEETGPSGRGLALLPFRQETYDARGASDCAPARQQRGLPLVTRPASGLDLRVVAPVLLVLVVQAVDIFGHLGRGGPTPAGNVFVLGTTVVVAAIALAVAGRLAAVIAAAAFGLCLPALWATHSVAAAGTVLLVGFALRLAISAPSPRRSRHRRRANLAHLAPAGSMAALAGAYLLSWQPAAMACCALGVAAAGLSQGGGRSVTRSPRCLRWLVLSGAAELVVAVSMAWHGGTGSGYWLLAPAGAGSPSEAIVPAALGALLLAVPAGTVASALVARWRGRAVLTVLVVLLAFAASAAAGGSGGRATSLGRTDRPPSTAAGSLSAGSAVMGVRT